MKPIVGISCGLRARDEDIVHELQDRYVRAIRQAGGLVVTLPRLAPEDAKHVAQFLDGIVISGGRSVVSVDAVRHRPRQFQGQCLGKGSGASDCRRAKSGAS